jgi:hypothetical protein
VKKIIFLLFLIITILLTSSSSLYSEEWCFVASSKNSYFFVDSESMNVGVRDVTFWILKQNIETGKIIFKKKLSVNCEDETVIVREVERFSSIDAFMDDILYEDNFKWRDILPGTKMRVIERMLCSDGEPIKNLKERLKKPFTRHEEIVAGK